jgi:hypothetical protein
VRREENKLGFFFFSLLSVFSTFLQIFVEHLTEERTSSENFKEEKEVLEEEEEAIAKEENLRSMSDFSSQLLFRIGFRSVVRGVGSHCYGFGFEFDSTDLFRYKAMNQARAEVWSKLAHE